MKNQTDGMLPPGSSTWADKVIVALDVEDSTQALGFVEMLLPLGIRQFKVGMRLYYREGPTILAALKKWGCRIFLDLKLHDIPNTVAQATESLVHLGVWMINVHALGGQGMMEAAKASAIKTASSLGVEPPVVIGVTVLTSMAESALQKDLLVSTPMEGYVSHLAGLSQGAGLDGVVCSPQEAKALRAQFGPKFLLVTPGIRLGGERLASGDDQQRIMTPKLALEAGADYLVIGRPLLSAKDPAQVALEMMADIQGAMATGAAV